MLYDGFDHFFYQSTDGLTLHAQIYGSQLSANPPVVCLAGLTGNARDFHSLAQYLSRDAASPRKVIAFDYRGRGQSAYDPNWKRYDVSIEAGDIIAGLMQLDIERAAFVGTSRGGLIIHFLGVLRSKLISAAVLNDIGPVVEVSGLQAIKDDHVSAQRPATFAEAVAQMKNAYHSIFSALTEPEWEQMAYATYRQDGATLRGDYDPALLHGLMDLDLSKPAPNLWPAFELLGLIPVLTIRGENSSILSAKTLSEMAARHPNFESIIVAGQGHAPLIGSGDLPQRIEAFLDRADQRIT